jgi:hypothetical protein
MSRPVKTLARNDMLSIADTVMRSERIRHLPILDVTGRSPASSASEICSSMRWCGRSVTALRHEIARSDRLP